MSSAPLDLLGVELFSSAIAMVCLLAARGRPLLPRNWRVFAALGVLEPGLGFGLFDFGLSRTGAADGALLIASESLFGVLLARVLLGERVSPVTRAAVAVGFAGSALVGLAEAGHGASLIGDLLVLAASAAAAGNGVGVRRMSAEADNLAATTTQLVAAALLVAPVILIADTGAKSGLASPDSAHVLAAVATGLLGGAVPFLAFNLAIRDLTVAHAGLMLNLIPVLSRRRRRRRPRRRSPVAADRRWSARRRRRNRGSFARPFLARLCATSGGLPRRRLRQRRFVGELTSRLWSGPRRRCPECGDATESAA